MCEAARHVRGLRIEEQNEHFAFDMITHLATHKKLTSKAWLLTKMFYLCDHCHEELDCSTTAGMPEHNDDAPLCGIYTLGINGWALIDGIITVQSACLACHGPITVNAYVRALVWAENSEIIHADWCNYAIADPDEMVGIEVEPQ